MKRRTLTTMALLGLTVARALPQIGLAQSDPLIGTWKLSLAKSTFNPGPAPKAGTLQAEGQGFRVTNEGADAQGKQVVAERMRGSLGALIIIENLGGADGSLGAGKGSAGQDRAIPNLLLL